MASFHLEIVSIDGLKFEDEVERVTLRSIAGDVAILAVGMGTAKLILPDGTERHGACIGGMLSVMDKRCHLLPSTWEWSDEIDVERAKEAKRKAEERLREERLSEEARLRAQAKLYRALIRLQTAGAR